MYKWIDLNTIADLSQIENEVPGEYNPRQVIDKLTKGLSGAVKAVLIETPYSDKDYRSTYYRFYAKKGQKFRSDCVRLHFFDQTVSFEESTLKLHSPDNRISDHYFGYMVLRPTRIATIGRSIVSPDVRTGPARGSQWFTITADHKVHLLGERLTIQGFPSMDQHVDIAVCAHVACWSILRHYSERYVRYQEHLTYDITTMAQQFNPGGLVPSLGLGVFHAERIFQEAGTFPLIVAKDNGSPEGFYQQLIAYVESGFPLFGVMSARSHAMAIIGYERKIPVARGSGSLRHEWKEIKSLVVVDDNYLPYLAIPTDMALKGPDDPYTAEDIDAFIVALPEGVYYPANAIAQVVPKLISFKPSLVGGGNADLVVRYFITTGAAFRRFTRSCESGTDPQLLREIMNIPFAQFVWVVELADEAQWASGQVALRAVIDATASFHETNPLWLVHSEEGAVVFDRADSSIDPRDPPRGFAMTAAANHTFIRMDQNLRPIQPK
jgi:hypothetical protein